MSSRAPIALFAFRRPDKMQSTLTTLLNCRGIEDSELYIFCDGPRGAHDEVAVTQVRNLARRVDHPHKFIIEAPSNQGLASSIIAGVTRLCREAGRAIVIEDDLIVSPAFLDYMNAALDAYASDSRVMQVSGFAFAKPGASPDQPARFLPMTTSWGWATWDRAWQAFDIKSSGSDRLQVDMNLRARFDLGGLWDYYGMLKRQRDGLLDSWAILWYWSVFNRSGLVLYPPVSLVRNDGLDASGTHTSRSTRLWGQHEELLPESAPPLPTEIKQDHTALAELGTLIDPFYLRRARYSLDRATTILSQRLSGRLSGNQ